LKLTFLSLIFIIMAAAASAAGSNAEIIHNPVLAAAAGQDIEIGGGAHGCHRERPGPALLSC